jgi:hypothetical protein
MPKATDGGLLQPLGGRNDPTGCYIVIPGAAGGFTTTGGGTEQFFVSDGTKKETVILLKALPEISDSKSANYQDEPIIGRAAPFKSYSHSENRTIGMTIHLYVTRNEDIIENITNLRAIESAVYPRDKESNITTPVAPPPVCKIRCSSMLSDNELCVVLRSYSVRFPTDVAWVTVGSLTFPMKVDIETTWDVVNLSRDLPGQERILRSGS